MAFWKPGASKMSVEALGSGNDGKKSAAAVPKPKLSKGVLSMKFMKQKEGPDSGSSSAEFPGRRSFNGCNKAVERYYEQKLEDLNYKKRSAPTQSETITDEEMLNRYESLIGLPRGPNQGKRPEVRKRSDKSVNQHKRSADSRNDPQQEDRNSSGQDFSKKKKRFA